MILNESAWGGGCWGCGCGELEMILSIDWAGISMNWEWGDLVCVSDVQISICCWGRITSNQIKPNNQTRSLKFDTHRANNRSG